MKSFVKITVFSFALIVCACSPQKRIARIAKKYNLVQTEIVQVSDTVCIPGDTLFFTVPSERDTVIVTKYGTIETTHDNGQNVVYVKVTTPPDTLINTVYVPVEKVVVQNVEKHRRVPWWLFVMLIAFVAFVTYAGKK